MDYYQDKEIERLTERVLRLKETMRYAVRIIRHPQMDNGNAVSAREVLETALREDDRQS